MFKETTMKSENTILNLLDDLIIKLDKNKHVIWMNNRARDFYLSVTNQFEVASFLDVCEKEQLNYPKILSNMDLSDVGNDRNFQECVNVSNVSMLWKIFIDNSMTKTITIIGKDITEIESLRVYQKNREILLDSLINILPGHYWWKNLKGQYTGCNKTVLDLLGIQDPGLVLGKTDYELPWSQIADELQQHDQAVIEAEVPLSFEENISVATGELNFLVTKRPLYNADNEMIGTIGTSVDITKQKRLERELIKAKQNEEELRKAATIFAGSVAHDLTTPLTNMNLMANNVSNIFDELLKIEETAKTIKNTLNDMQFSYLEKFPQSLQTQLTELNEYIKDSLKALNKTVSGIKTQDDLVKCELWRCMQKVIDEYPYLENEKDLIHWDTTYLFNFMGNPLLFYRIMFNLIKNSLYQIQEKGHGEIFIRAEQTDTHNVLYFKDTAGGVTQKTVDNIFNSYQTTKAEGTGVGLAFCKLTMQSFGGEMNCRLVDGDHIEFKLEFIKT